MTFPRETARFSFVWLSGLALAVAATGCSGGGTEEASAGNTSTSSAGSGGASSGGAGGNTASTTGGGNPSTSSSGSTGASTSTSTSSTSSASGGTPTGQCPADATFCSGFEEAGLPSGAKYFPSYQAKDWASFMAIDAAVFRAGASSLQVKPGGSGYSWRMLGVPTPGATFWVRLYVRSDVDLGQAEHNAFFQAMTGDGEPNTGDNVEVAEQYCQVVLNLHDQVVLSTGGSTACGSGGALLAKNTWHCVEASFDGTKGDVQVYADGNKIIDKTGWTKLTYKTFSFGFLGFHGPGRTMWYDDVAVAPQRIGCAP